MVLWHSKMVESEDFVTAESFDYWKFVRFMRRAMLLLETFTKFRFMTEDAIKQQRLGQRPAPAVQASPPAPPPANSIGDPSSQ
jgi:hypothetical protein